MAVPLSPISRRDALRGLVGAGVMAGGLGVSARAAAATPPRALWLRHAGTGETLRLTYFERGDYVEDALQAADHFFRDHHREAQRFIDLRLLDLISAIQARLGRSEPLFVTSAYRTEETNAELARRGARAAPRSFHVLGMAADITAPGVGAAKLGRLAREFGHGGVGVYRRTGHVHLDVGPVRAWSA